MSAETVQIAKDANAAFNRGDLEAVFESFAPDAELEDLANGPDQASVVVGIDSMREALALWFAAFDELRTDVEDYVDTGDAVICAAHWIGRGKASGISIDVRQFDVYEFRGGKVIRATLGHKSKEEALRAAGREQ
jgi:ketosteroid isomerase-like protein